MGEQRGGGVALLGRAAAPRRAEAAREVAARLDRAAAEARAAADRPHGVLPAGAAATVELARSVGAPVADVLDRAALVARARAEVHDEARISAAQATAVSRTMLVLPLVAVPALGALLELPLVGFYTTPVGAVLGAASGLALALAASWTWVLRRSVHAAAGEEPVAAEAMELVAVAASAALPLATALRRAASTLERADPTASRTVCGLRRLAMADELGVEPPDDGTLPELAGVAAANRRGGVAVVGLLHHAADARRAAHRVAVRERAQRLSTQLVLPTTLLVLPATVALVAGPLLAVALDTAA